MARTSADRRARRWRRSGSISRKTISTLPRPEDSMNTNGGGGVGEWIGERIAWKEITGFLRRKRVPQHKHSFWYIFGGLTLFFFIVQIISGILLLFYYSPTPDTANDSIHLIMTKVPFGWLIRSIHGWSADLMVAMMLIHLFSTFLMRAYRKPREILWMTGVIQLFLVLGFAFTGYLLPWDAKAYSATKIGTEIPTSIPFLRS